MIKKIDYSKCRLTNEAVHIQFTDGESYVFTIEEIVSGLTGVELEIVNCECKGQYYHSGCKLVYKSLEIVS